MFHFFVIINFHTQTHTSKIYIKVRKTTKKTLQIYEIKKKHDQRFQKSEWYMTNDVSKLPLTLLVTCISTH